MSNIPKIIGSLHKEKGKKTEDKVRGALDLLKDEEKIDQYVCSRELDRRGMDFVAQMGRKRYKLSVKSSEGGIGHEREAHPERYRHEDIIFIVPGRDESEKELATRILSEINELEEKMHGQ